MKIVPKNSRKSAKDVPVPQRPRRTIYPKLRGSEAPVAEQYMTRASGSLAYIRGNQKQKKISFKSFNRYAIPVA